MVTPRALSPHRRCNAPVQNVKSVNVRTTEGSLTVPAVWVGQHLAVHRPIDSKQPDNLSRLPRWWRISHISTGYAAGPGIDAAQRDVIALAKLWDRAFAVITAAGDATGWKWRERWADDLSRIIHGKPLIGPRDLTPLEELESAGTAAAVEKAVRRAMGYESATDTEAAEQFAARETVSADLLRDGPDGLEMLWRGRWWPVPTFGEVESWALDSLAETPDGRTVEPDAPDAWPRLLGIV